VFDAWDVRQQGPLVTLAGAGMDETLLVLSRSLSTKGMGSLALTDLTVDCQGHELADVHTNGVTIALRRCRVVGWGYELADGRLHLLASQCRFEAGYGRPPGQEILRGFGSLHDALAQYESCVFRGPFREPYDKGAALYLGCRFEEMFPTQRVALVRPPRRVRLIECTVDYLREDRPTALIPRSLADVNPAWAR
jgi:hypothetical protein